MRLESSVRTPLAVRPVRAAVAAAAPKPAPRPADAPEAPSGLSAFFHGAIDFVKHLVRPSGTWTNPDAPAAPDRGGIKVASYNIEVGGRRLGLVERDLRAMDADVVTLQETSEDSARALAKRLGMHVAYHHNPFHVYGGNAILSRYPIEEAKNIDLVNPMVDRLKEVWRKFRQGDPRIAPMDARHMLHARIRVGDRPVDVLTSHLTLFGAETNAKQLNQMADLAASLERQGHTVVVTGDFNTNFSLSGKGQADAKGSYATPTDTAAEFKARYRDMSIGNNGLAADQAAMNRMRSQLNYYWDAPTRTVKVDGRDMTPDQIRAALAQEQPGTARHAALLRAFDGVTISKAKRFDNIFSSKDTRITEAHIDQTTKASDHQPVLAEVRWEQASSTLG